MAFGDVDITPGAGAAVGVDLISGVNYQRNKLMDGTEGGTEGIPGSLARGLRVDPAVLPWEKTLTPTISTGAYAAGDVMGALLTASDVARGAGKSIIVDNIRLIDRDQEMKPIDVILFKDSTGLTIAADNGVYDPADADLDLILDVISITPSDYSNFNDNSIATRRNIGGRYILTGDDLYVLLVIRFAATYTATSDIKLIISGIAE